MISIRTLLVFLIGCGCGLFVLAPIVILLLLKRAPLEGRAQGFLGTTRRTHDSEALL
jgi:hypothetical protein